MSLRTASMFKNVYLKLNENSSVTIKIRMQKLIWESVFSWNTQIYKLLSNTILKYETAENEFSTLIEALMLTQCSNKPQIKILYNIHFVYCLDENHNSL